MRVFKGRGGLRGLIQLSKGGYIGNEAINFGLMLSSPHWMLVRRNPGVPTHYTMVLHTPVLHK